MRIGVIGSRSFLDYKLLEMTLNKISDRTQISSIISGGAKGADSLAEQYANLNNIDTTIFKPDWSFGKGAAAIRNIKIVENSDIIVAFWDGVSKGTKMTIDIATSKNIKVFKVIYK
jgi:hypothetical protein